MDTFFQKIQHIRLTQFNRIAPVCLAICILYLCWKLASFFWLIVVPPQALQIMPISVGSQQLSVPNIGSFALFAEMNSAADQNLNMILQGVVVGSSNQLSSAVIKVGDKAESYRVGELVGTTSFRLAEVSWDSVVLLNDRGGRQEIKFSGIENGLYQPMVSDRDRSTNHVDHTINQAIQNLQDNKDGYLKDIGLVGSHQNGYEITENVSNSLKNKLRLQTGDKVLSLNGQSLGNGKTEVELLELAKQTGQVKLEVQRGDQVITIQQNLK